MRRAALVVSAALFVALTACGSTPAVVRGRVAALRYDAPHDEEREVCMVYGKYGCQSWIPETDHYDASWHVLVNGFDKNGKARKAWREVSAEAYARCAVGDSFSVADGCTKGST